MVQVIFQKWHTYAGRVAVAKFFDGTKSSFPIFRAQRTLISDVSNLRLVCCVDRAWFGVHYLQRFVSSNVFLDDIQQLACSKTET